MFFTVLAITVVDLSRMVLGVHYLSDVIAGNLLGLAALCFALSAASQIRQYVRLRESAPAFRFNHLAALLLIQVVLVLLLFFMKGF